MEFYLINTPSKEKTSRTGATAIAVDHSYLESVDIQMNGMVKGLKKQPENGLWEMETKIYLFIEKTHVRSAIIFLVEFSRPQNTKTKALCWRLQMWQNVGESFHLEANELGLWNTHRNVRWKRPTHFS